MTKPLYRLYCFDDRLPGKIAGLAGLYHHGIYPVYTIYSEISIREHLYKRNIPFTEHFLLGPQTFSLNLHAQAVRCTPTRNPTEDQNFSKCGTHDKLAWSVHSRQSGLHSGYAQACRANLQVSSPCRLPVAGRGIVARMVTGSHTLSRQAETVWHDMHYIVLQYKIFPGNRFRATSHPSCQHEK